MFTGLRRGALATLQRATALSALPNSGAAARRAGNKGGGNGLHAPQVSVKEPTTLMHAASVVPAASAPTAPVVSTSLAPAEAGMASSAGAVSGNSRGGSTGSGNAGGGSAGGGSTGSGNMGGGSARGGNTGGGSARGGSAGSGRARGGSAGSGNTGGGNTGGGSMGNGNTGGGNAGSGNAAAASEAWWKTKPAILLLTTVATLLASVVTVLLQKQLAEAEVVRKTQLAETAQTFTARRVADVKKRLMRTATATPQERAAKSAAERVLPLFPRPSAEAVVDIIVRTAGLYMFCGPKGEGKSSLIQQTEQKHHFVIRVDLQNGSMDKAVRAVAAAMSYSLLYTAEELAAKAAGFTMPEIKTVQGIGDFEELLLAFEQACNELRAEGAIGSAVPVLILE